MQIGNYYKDILCESVYDKKSAKVRIQTLPGQVIPEGVFVESRKTFRTDYPLGTKFTTEDVKVCQKPEGPKYLRAKDQMLYPLEGKG